MERVPVRIFEDSKSAAAAVAKRIADRIRAGVAAGKPTVLGLATGNTPVNVYGELARMHAEEGLDLSGVVTFNLDEYWPIAHDAVQSYHRWMQENFFQWVNIRPENIHIPSGEVSAKRAEAFCREYEEALAAAGGLDFQILGIGRSGHIGFNEPGSKPDSRTRRVHLDRVTRLDAAGDFFGTEHVPQMAITMGVGTIFEAREVALLAFGEHKAPICRRAVEEPPSPHVAASYLQEHPAATFYLDEAAAAGLTRLATPWLHGPCLWDAPLRRQAVIWLARKLKTPILKLTDEDYEENALGELRQASGGAYHVNLEVFRGLMETITGWPAGKASPRRVLILSPHPDDDVICMGGTMRRLVEQEHDVHVAYMVSGCLSVFDHDVARYADFAREFNRIFHLAADQIEGIERHVDKFLRHKHPGDVDSAEIQAIKTLIRRGEARDAAEFCGLVPGSVHFLEMPFYDTGMVQKNRIGAEDIAQAALAALEQHVADGADRTDVWLYRGAWEEWAPEQIEMAVPLSPDELKRKRFAIFRHQSQKDRAMFPGPYDSREFWQRAEERNMATAATYDALGLPEYHALEAFARWPLARANHAAAQLDR